MGVLKHTKLPLRTGLGNRIPPILIQAHLGTAHRSASGSNGREFAANVGGPLKSKNYKAKMILKY